MSEARRTTMGLPVGTWIAIGGFIFTVVTAGGALMGKIFATKGEVAAVEKTVDHELHKVESVAETKLQNWRIEKLEVTAQNIEVRQQRTDENIVRLMERFNVRPVPEPVMRSMPLPPPMTADEPNE